MSEPLEAGRIVEHAKLMDTAALGTVVMSFVDAHMQGIALSLGALWYAIQIWESATGGTLRKHIRNLLLKRGPF